eukprot:3952744-Alexandrium_andersonii.AAC.1
MCRPVTGARPGWHGAGGPLQAALVRRRRPVAAVTEKSLRPPVLAVPAGLGALPTARLTSWQTA